MTRCSSHQLGCSGATRCLWICVIFLVGSKVKASDGGKPILKGGDYCMFDTFQAACARDEVVQIEGAHYGRMRLGKCVSADLGYIGCFSDVLDIVDNRCSGRRSCSVTIPDKEIASRKLTDTCFTELTMYLEANYTCRKVLGVKQQQCQNCDYVKLTQPGTVASVTTRESGCGSPDCPWLIEAPPGQRINISLVNYGWRAGESNVWPITCQAYATVRETATSTAKEICASSRRHSHVFTSLSHSIELRVVGADRRMNSGGGSEFLFTYDFFGCEDLAPPRGGWMRRYNDVITMGCNNSDTTWKTRCVNNEWTGDRLSCPGFGPEAPMGSIKIGRVVLPSVLSVVIIVAVAFVVGVLILCIGVILFRRRYVRQHLEQRSSLYPSGTPATPGGKHGGDTGPGQQAKDSLYMPPMYSTNPRQESPPKTMRQQSYTHIWERPLPNPTGVNNSGGNDCMCPSGSGGVPRKSSSSPPPDYESSDYNSLDNGSDPVLPVTVAAAHARSVSGSVGNSRRMVYGNNTIARKECEKLSPDSDIDSRYFQLDPETMSSGGL